MERFKHPLKTKKRLLNSLVVSVPPYCSECWVFESVEQKKASKFEVIVLPHNSLHLLNREECKWICIAKDKLLNRLANTIYACWLTRIGHIFREPGAWRATSWYLMSEGRGRRNTSLCNHIKGIWRCTLVRIARRLAQDPNNWMKFVERATTDRNWALCSSWCSVVHYELITQGLRARTLGISAGQEKATGNYLIEFHFPRNKRYPFYCFDYAKNRVCCEV